ncbi:hypothetical protein D3C86_2219700 [compost metagenome]
MGIDRLFETDELFLDLPIFVFDLLTCGIHHRPFFCVFPKRDHSSFGVLRNFKVLAVGLFEGQPARVLVGLHC